MKVFNFNNQLVQYLKEQNVSKLLKKFQKPNKLFALTNIDINEYEAIYMFEKIEFDVELLIVSKTDALKIFNELILYIKEEIEEYEIEVEKLTGIFVAIYDILEDISIVLFSDFDVHWKQKILQQMSAITNSITLEYHFILIEEFENIKDKISKDTLSIIEDKILLKD